MLLNMRFTLTCVHLPQQNFRSERMCTLSRMSALKADILLSKYRIKFPEFIFHVIVFMLCLHGIRANLMARLDMYHEHINTMSFCCYLKLIQSLCHFLVKGQCRGFAKLQTFLQVSTSRFSDYSIEEQE